MNVYLVSFTSPAYPAILRATILDYLNTQSIVKNWYAPMPNAILVVTPGSISDITRILMDRFPQNLIFLVTDASQANGLANDEIWEFVNNPKSSGRWI